MPEPISARVAARLQARRGEIEQTVLARVYAVADPPGSGAEDPEYAQGLRAAVSAAVSYGLDGLEGGAGRSEAIPVVLFSQARHAARNGIGLATVLRRYLAGYTLLGDFIAEAAQEDESPRELRGMMRAQAARFDRLVMAVSEEYGREAGQAGSHHQRRAELVKALIDGELADTAELSYDVGAWHLALVGAGAPAERTIRELAAALDRRLLLTRPGGETVWAWLGGRQAISVADLARLGAFQTIANLPLALGEPAEGLAGWRLTHRQAVAAWPIAGRRRATVRYADVALLASVLQDDLLVASLRRLYLEPLSRERDGGAVLRETLRAYIAAEQNVSSAAAALGVSRQAVAKRLQAVEGRLGRPLSGYRMEIEAALHLEDLTTLTVTPGTGSPDHIVVWPGSDG